MFIRFPEAEIVRAGEALYAADPDDVRTEFEEATGVRLEQKSRWMTTLSDIEGPSWQWGEKNGTPDQLIDRAILHGIHCAHKLQVQARLN